ncbi:MAG: C39 family peptidase [Parcubacteria group bacterium]|nr:C39 family peptidase [Parcubacteria group bacterium]
MKKSFKYGLIIVIIIILTLIYYLYPRNLDKDNNNDLETLLESDEKVVEIDNNDEKQKTTKDTELTENTEKKEPQKKESLPTSKKLEVPFIPQAPYKDWSEPWQNACEEAALLTLHHYIQGNSTVSSEQVKQEILDMIDWQMTYFGSHKDLDMSEVAIMAKEYLGYKDVKVTYNIEIDDIKHEIANNNPVLIPVAGQVLDNPNYTPPGPVYHNLAVIGYTEKMIITNDPGTRLGAGFQYTYNNFYNSIHDFLVGANKKNPSKMLEGRKAMLVINDK